LKIDFRGAGLTTLAKKLAINVLKIIEVGEKPLSLAKKRFKIGINPEKHLQKIFAF